MIDVLIITHNESKNLPFCLESLKGWTRKVFVVDSGSTDDTVQLARDHAAEVVHHDWPGYSKQRNWALNNLPLQTPWVLILDADESIPPALRERLVELTGRPVDDVPENGFFINRLTYFMGRPIRHCGYFPSWNMRLFKRGAAQYEDRLVHEHMIIDDPVGYIHETITHNDRRGMAHYLAKHEQYATLEATELCREMQAQRSTPDSANLPAMSRRRRWLKRNLMRRLPFPGLWRFTYMYFFKLGILDGATGFRFCKFIGGYDALVSAKLRALLAEKEKANETAP